MNDFALVCGRFTIVHQLLQLNSSSHSDICGEKERKFYHHARMRWLTTQRSNRHCCLRCRGDGTWQVLVKSKGLISGSALKGLLLSPPNLLKVGRGTFKEVWLFVIWIWASTALSAQHGRSFEVSLSCFPPFCSGKDPRCWDVSGCTRDQEEEQIAKPLTDDLFNKTTHIV